MVSQKLSLIKEGKELKVLSHSLEKYHVAPGLSFKKMENKDVDYTVSII